MGGAKYLPKAPYRMIEQFDLGTDFGNGDLDQRLFQIDGSWNDYREAKLDAPRERILRTADFAWHEPQVARYLVDAFANDQPVFFRRKTDGFSHELYCRLSAERFLFDQQMRIINDSAYTSSVDALIGQVQEDFAVLKMEGDGNRIIYLNVHFPNRWRPEALIGKDFAAAHRPVPKMAEVAQRSGQRMLSVQHLKDRRIVQFATGLTYDPRLDHHPDVGEIGSGRLHVRTERQTLIPHNDLMFFTIRTYQYDCAELDRQELVDISSWVDSMDERTRAYKSITPEVVNDLSTLIRQS